MLYDTNKIESIKYQSYLKWFDEFIQDLPEIHYIYIKTDYNTAYDRILKRARSGENIPIEYIKKCNDYHDNWLLSTSTSTSKSTSNVTIIDGNGSPENTLTLTSNFIKNYI